MTSKYVTASRARHVTFPRVFSIGLWGVRYSLHSIAHARLFKEKSLVTVFPCAGVGMLTPWSSHMIARLITYLR